MARIKLVYIGGGSTRAPGTMASFIDQGTNFDGSEIVLVDLDPERLEIVRRLARKMAQAAGLDLTIWATTDRQEALTDCDAVLTSYRPGGFEARYLDESLPLRHGVIGQETQGPGGFFMALRSVHVIRQIVAEMESRCPKAILFNYTNPINIVSEAVSHHSDIPIISLCEGPIIFPEPVLRAADLDPDRADITMVGLNHACWSVHHNYGGADLMPLLQDAYERQVRTMTVADEDFRLLKLAITMGAVPASYFKYYYFKDEVIAELRAKPTTRSQDILAAVPDYWQHYREQATLDVPMLDPARSRGGIHELELAIDVMDAIFNDRGEVWPVNVPNQGALADFPDDLVVEVYAQIDGRGVTRQPQVKLLRPVLGLLQMLGEYQALAAQAAWCGARGEALQALASHPFCYSLNLAERLYDEMAAADKDYLPERLLQ